MVAPVSRAWEANGDAARIAVIVTTYKRPPIITRLVSSLAAEPRAARICVVDNGGDKTLQAHLQRLDARACCLDAGTNLGCGGGLALGCQEMLKDNAITHLWIVDDDVQLLPGCADQLLKAMQSAKADVAVPLMAEHDGNIISFPGPLAGRAWREIRRRLTPDEFVSICGDAPLEFVWSPGPCLLVTRRAAMDVGLPRTEYWLMGEDLEYTCRLSSQYRSVLAPAARAMHLQHSSSKEAQLVKFGAMLTNLAYTASKFRHGRRLLRHLPGNYVRFLKAFGFSTCTLSLALRFFYWGAVCRIPAGGPRFQKFRTDYLESARANS